MSENIFAAMRDTVVAALRRAVPELPDEVAARVEVTPAREAAHGDMATNAAMVSAKAARQAPARIAQALAAALADAPGVLRAEPAGPGFVNIHLRPETLRAVVPAVLRAGEAYGSSAAGQGRPVNVEYVSANPTGPLHVGHCRGAVVGDALANLLGKAGFAVTKEYYINDAGAQVVALAWAAYWRYLQAAGTALTEDEFSAAVPGGLQYRGEYLVPVGQALFAAHGGGLAGPDGGIADPAGWFDTVREFTVEAMMTAIRADLAALGVEHDVFSSERALVEAGAPDRTIERLDAQGLIYQGTLEPPKGKLPEDWEAREQTLFRSTGFGDDVDRPLRKSDGSNTYFANDIAYHDDKIRRGAGLMID
ncbi:MAG: arginine--tRNA ligase, partial [Janthinobacterium lividum]